MKAKAEILALIPARGGSKGVPRKNVLPVAGKPLIVYSIEHALASRYVTRTVVSTDDSEIAAVALAAGAEVPFRRPAEFAADDSTDLEVFRHALEWLLFEQGYFPDLVLHLRPTSPARRPAKIDRAIELMLEHPEADSLRSVCLAEHTPYKMWKIVGNYMEPAFRVEGMPEAHSAPRQKLPPIYAHNGYVDIVRPRTIFDLDSMCGACVLPYLVEQPGDLDTIDQLPALERALTVIGRSSVEELPWPH